jgi:hypothetical protein
VAERRASFPQIRNRELMAIAARAWPIPIVQELRTVERRGQTDTVLPTEHQHLVGQRREVGRDHKLNVATLRRVPLKDVADDPFDEVEVQQRFATLELDLQRRRRRLKHQVNRPSRSLDAHVESRAIFVDARHLAIGARMIASQRHHKHVEACEALKEALLRAVFRRQQLQGHDGRRVVQKVFRF